jgi:hypothetical protein
MREKWDYSIVEGGKGLTGDKIRDASTDILNRPVLDGRNFYAAIPDAHPTIFYPKRPR